MFEGLIKAIGELTAAVKNLWQDRIEQKLDHIILQLDVINERTSRMAGNLDRVESEVTEISGTVDSAIALLNQLAQLIRDSAGDAEKANALADQLDAKGNDLAAAIVANTPEQP